jgi:hypothetical protein
MHFSTIGDLGKFLEARTWSAPAGNGSQVGSHHGCRRIAVTPMSSALPHGMASSCLAAELSCGGSTRRLGGFAPGRLAHIASASGEEIQRDRQYRAEEDHQP